MMTQSITDGAVEFSPDKDISNFLQSHAHEDLYLIVITLIRENGVYLELVVFGFEGVSS